MAVACERLELRALVTARPTRLSVRYTVADRERFRHTVCSRIERAVRPSRSARERRMAEREAIFARRGLITRTRGAARSQPRRRKSLREHYTVYRRAADIVSRTAALMDKTGRRPCGRSMKLSGKGGAFIELNRRRGWEWREVQTTGGSSNGWELQPPSTPEYIA